MKQDTLKQIKDKMVEVEESGNKNFDWDAFFKTIEFVKSEELTVPF